MRATVSLLPYLLVGLLAGVAGVGQAQTSPEMTAAAAVLCASESGAAAAACNEYCAVLSCPQVAGAGQASQEECANAKAKFKRLTGREVPCEELLACPCADPANWTDPAVASTWQTFAMGGFNAANATCSDDASQTELEEDAPDFQPTRAGVDVSGSECSVFNGFVSQSTLVLRVGMQQAEACRRLLRRAGGRLCR